jgi:hypothetical protein
MNALHIIRKTLFPCALALFILLAFAEFARGQSSGSAPAPAALSTADLNVLLAQLDQTAQTTNLDLAKLRIEKWKTNGDARQQLQSNADSLSRNITGALPGMIGAVRSSPDNMAANFKLYRNVDALFDVLSALADAASNSAPHGDFQALGTDVSNLEAIRHALADRIEAMATMRDAMLARGANGSTASAKSGSKSGVKKIVIDDTAPAKSSPRKKKPAATTPQ